jgi:cellobiose-specific phosphotransferase system component IIC
MSQTSDTLTRPDRLATLLTNLFAPAHLVIGILLVVGATSHPSPIRGLGWGALAALLVGVLPYAWVLHAVRQGRFTSRRVPDRAQRLLPLAVAATAAVAALAVLAFLGAPRVLVALMLAMLTGLTVTAAITRYWKISLHTAVASGTATIFAIMFGPALLATGVLVAAIGWSRVQVRDHTPLQVVLGALVGAVVAAIVFPPLR